MTATEFKAIVDAKYPLSCTICTIRNQKLILSLRLKVEEYYKTARGLFKNKRTETRPTTNISKKERLLQFILDFCFWINFWGWQAVAIALIVYGIRAGVKELTSQAVIYSRASTGSPHTLWDSLPKVGPIFTLQMARG